MPHFMLFSLYQFIFFLVLELVVFPTYCGVLIDLCTLPLFGPEVTIASRIQFTQSHTAISLFLHWMAGTTFMFQYANYVSMVRGILRPGTLWFLRDPNDPRFQPLQEIISRPFFSQLRKLGFGVFLYSVIVSASVGGFTLGILGIQTFAGQNAGIFKVFPLRWDYK
jgi:E3 ubiquitin-protein ligase DOA10